MKLLLYVMTGFVAVSSFTSCSKYLDVQPEDLFLEGYVFSSPSEVRKALNGVYISMAKTDLYGLNLTSGTVDVLGQYYNCGHWDHSYNLVQLYEYDRKEVQSKFTAIWDAGYATLLNINNIIVQLEAGKGGLRDDEKAIILGEAYGLRAFISFDLLRLFGPQLTVAADELAMPYPTEPKPMIHTIFSGSEVMEKVLHDMNVAHELLQKDPILEQGVAETDVNGNQFMGRRNRRMNAKAMIKEVAPAFTLLDRAGKEVSLADYKGKVVVLDFWATWCGHCIVSFPGMQAAVNKYKDDEEVQFLFIDTWQKEKNYKELVEEFITKNNYTFYVLFDEMKDSDKAAVTAFKADGIPTKVVIDKNGFIRFQSAGGSSNIDDIVADMEVKIELAKKASQEV